MVSQAKDVRAILADVFPEECKALGPSTVDDIVDGAAIEVPDEGRPFPLMEVAELLRDAAEFAAACLGIYATMQSMTSGEAKPTEERFEKEVRKARPNRGRLSEAQAEKITHEVHRRRR